MSPIIGNNGRRDRKHLLVILLVVVGLALIEVSEGRRGHASEQRRREDHDARCGRRPKVVGRCRAGLTRWSYVGSGKCEKFQWGGCGSETENRFSSPLECEQACLGSQPAATSSTPKPGEQTDEHERPSACLAPKKLGSCNGQRPPQSAYFDADKGECRPVPRNSCARGQNAFTWLENCQETCLSSRELCALPPKVMGNCRALLPRWSYVEASGKCEPFNWGGCGGNGNKFYSQSECEETCAGGAQPTTGSTPKPAETDEIDKPNACYARKILGRCKDPLLSRRYYYDIETGKCQSARCPLCTLGENSFDGSMECMQTCEASLVCAMPPREGRECGGFTTAYWSYDRFEGECVRWTYRGCGGNENRFRSQAKCEQTCGSSRWTTSTTPEPDPYPIEEE